MVCKSLLGKAHTVMAEGGIAAAMANVDPADDWRTHFRDTMRGGKFLNNWRMAQLHAQEAPDRVRELEQWGALFDRTDDGRILQRAFGGHTYQTPLPRRRPHRPGNDPHPAGPRRATWASTSTWSAPSPACSTMATASPALSATGARTGRFVVFKAKSVVLATGGIGKAWPITSNSWEYTGDGMALAYEAGAELMDMEFVQFHPTGMVWPPGRAGHSRHRSRARRRRHPAQQSWRTLHGEATIPSAWNSPPATSWRASIYTEVQAKAAAPNTAAHFSISRTSPPNTSRRKLPSMYHQFKELADVDITKGPMEVGPTCHYMMGGSAWTPRPPQLPCRACLPPAKPPPASTARTASAEIHSPICWSLAAAPDLAAAEHAK